jgi:hypothetical protein
LIKTRITTALDAKTDALVNPLVIKATEAVAGAKHARIFAYCIKKRIAELEVGLKHKSKKRWAMGRRHRFCVRLTSGSAKQTDCVRLSVKQS